MQRPIMAAAASLVWTGAAGLGAQVAPGGSLELVSSDGTSRTLTPADLAALPRTETVAFTVTEVDPQFGDRTAIVASTRNGEALDERDGPLQIVLPEDEFHARWVRQLVRLRLLQPAGETSAARHE